MPLFREINVKFEFLTCMFQQAGLPKFCIFQILHFTIPIDYLQG